MKKTIYLMICVLTAAGVSAQSHTFRDTSYVPYWQFDFDAWVMEDPIHNGKIYVTRPRYPDQSRSSVALEYDDILQYNYTDDPAGMKVVGLSATIFLVKAQLSTEVPPEYLLLYEATPDSFILKAQVQWDETDTAGRPCPLLMLNQISCHNTSGQDGIIYQQPYLNNPFYAVKQFDYYFDKPITVYDSFYVGGTCHAFEYPFTHEPGPVSKSSYLTFRTTWVGYDSTCVLPALWKLYHYHQFGDLPFNQWYWRPSNQFLLVLPIIEVVDTTFNAPVCPVVSGLFVRGNYTDTVTVQWDYDSLHPEYQLWYGPEADFETHNAMVSLRTNKWVFSDASYADTQMIAYVRTVCHEYDTLRYSEWGRPIRFMLHHEEQDTTGHGDIGVPEAGDDLARFVQLMPNPASGSVLVNSSYVIRRVEAYDVRGEKVMEQPTEGRTAVIDVTAWPKGAYVVLVRTPQGTAAKRLVVQ
ncbi:MAG: T9SS type A sorting domain-containing protein [Bacteroidales bacterium]|nr:T9SS type A sorting domain-containing protein [Bacteroidales bacterium]